MFEIFAPTTPPPTLPFVDTHDLSLGTVWQQPQVAFSLPVQNKSKSRIVVDNVTTSCNCTDVEPKNFDLEPGEQIELHGTIDLLKSLVHTQEVEEPFMVTLTAHVSQPESEIVEWPLHGMVRKVFELEPKVIHLNGASEVISGVSAPSVTVEITPFTGIQSIKSSCNTELGEVRVEKADEGDKWRLTFQPNINIPRGPIQGVITLSTQFDNGEAGPDVDVEVVGFSTATVRLSPSQVTLAADPEGVPAIVNLLSRDNQVWGMQEVKNKPTWLDVHNEESSGVLQIRVSEIPDRLESFTIILVLYSDQGKLEELPLTLNLFPAVGKEISTPVSLEGKP